MSDFESGSTATFPAPLAGGRMVAGDFDGDGDADLLYQTGGNGTAFQYARSNGDGTFTILALGASPFAGLTLPDNLGGNHYTGDFDGDGDVDLVAAVNSTTGSFFLNNGTSFALASSATLPAPAAATRMITGDFDGDGDADILYQTGATGTAFQYARSNGDGTFTILSQASSPFAGVSFVDHNGSNYLASDFDGDGDVDIIATPNGTQGEFYRNDGGTFAEGSTATFPLPAAGGRMTAGDFDADGDSDILFQTGANGTAFQYARSNGDGTFTILALASSPFAGLTLPDDNGSNFFAADFDGDGDTDLLANGAAVGTSPHSYFYQVGKPPELVSSTPADNAVGVAVGANIVLTFDESVSKGNGNIYIVRASDNMIIESISVNSAQVTGSGTTWTIDPSVTLAGLTNYAIQLDAGTFKDADNAIFAGIDDMVTLSFTTMAVNAPPVQAVNSGLTLSEGASGTITAARLDFNDAEQADTAITYTLTSAATNGTLQLSGVGLGLGGTFTQDDINNGRVTFIHNGGETTSATFGFSVSDGAGGSVTGQSFAFTITPVNDAPVHSLPTAVFTYEETIVGLNGGFALDPPPSWISDADSGIVTTTLSASDGAFSVTGSGTALVTGSGTNSVTITGSVADVNLAVYHASYTPALNVDGVRTITVTISDGSLSDSDSITVLIASVRDAPEGADVTRTATEDTAYVLQTTDFGFSDIDGHAFAAVVLSSVPLHGRIIDIGGYTIEEDITGDGIPDVFLAAPERELGAGETIDLALITGGYIRYLPAANASGAAADSFTFQVVDAGAGMAGTGNVDPTPNTMTFDITAINDAPVNTVGATVNTSEDVAVELAGMSVSDVDAAGPVAYSLAVTNGVLTIRTDVVGGITAGQVQVLAGTGNGTATINLTATASQINATLAAAGGLIYTPNADFNGTETLQVYVNDGGQSGLDPNPVSILDPVVDADVGPLTEEDVDTRSIVVAAVDDAAVAQNDAAATSETATVGGNLFADSGWGADSDSDGPALSISAVNGVAANVGTQITLASGALLTVNADGTYSYDPNGAFDYLIDGATAAATGALNTSALDSFTYTLTAGGMATVTVTINGVASADDELWGSPINNTVTGTAGVDYFDLSQGGEDTVGGLDGNDAFYFGKAFTGGDAVDGGAGDNDQIGLEGDYAGANALVLDAGTITGIEVIAALPGYDYDITTVDANVASGGKLAVFAGNLGAGDNFTFDGSAETDGSFLVYGGMGTDLITTGAGDDGIYFGPGEFDPTVDRIDGGAGTNDQLALDGDYLGLLLDGTAIQNVEVIVLLKGVPGDLAQYNLTIDASLVAPGETLTIWGAQVETAMTVAPNAATNGQFRMFGGTAGDTLVGGASSDWFWGGLGGDTLVGGAGADTYLYEDAAESSAAGFDRLSWFDDTIDTIDLDGRTVTGFAGPLVGALDADTLGAQLEASAATLGVGEALVFTANGGDLAGKSFLLIDGNDTAGYQANGDFVIELIGAIGPIDNLGMFV